MEQVRSTGSHSIAFVLLVLVMLAGLPVAVWLDLSNLSETSLLRQAKDLILWSAASAATTRATWSAACWLRRARPRSCIITRTSRAPYRSPPHFRSSSGGSSASSRRTSLTGSSRIFRSKTVRHTRLIVSRLPRSRICAITRTSSCPRCRRRSSTIGCVSLRP